MQMMKGVLLRGFQGSLHITPSARIQVITGRISQMDPEPRPPNAPEPAKHATNPTPP